MSGAISGSASSAQTEPAATSAASRRLESLDGFRGLTLFWPLVPRLGEFGPVLATGAVFLTGWLILFWLHRRKIYLRFGVALKIEAGTRVAPGRRLVLMGSTANPLVQAERERRRLPMASVAESYALSVTSDAVVVAGADDAGAFYGLQSPVPEAGTIPP